MAGVYAEEKLRILQRPSLRLILGFCQVLQPTVKKLGITLLV
jgi:hypothetical protein